MSCRRSWVSISFFCSVDETQSRIKQETLLLISDALFDGRGPKSTWTAFKQVRCSQGRFHLLMKRQKKAELRMKVKLGGGYNEWQEIRATEVYSSSGHVLGMKWTCCTVGEWDATDPAEGWIFNGIKTLISCRPADLWRTKPSAIIRSSAESVE